MASNRAILLRFFDKVIVTDTCWLWRGANTGTGYGVFRENDISVVAHRWLYSYLNGPPDKKLDMDHLCRVRNCVNPFHLEPVTRQKNLLRGAGPTLKNELRGKKSHCVNGHKFTRKTSGINKRGYRFCRECININQRIRRTLTTNKG